MHLTGCASELTEQKIGERVFARPEGYKPGDDNIVRNYARLLRQRLDHYFAEEGQHERLRILVPRGAYIPLVVESGMPSSGAQAEITQVPGPGTIGDPSPAAEIIAAPRETVERKTAQHWHLRALWIALAISATLLAISTGALLQARQVRTRPVQMANPLWSAFFSTSRNTIVIPADTGLVIYQELSKKRIHLAEYASGEYQKRLPYSGNLAMNTINDLGLRRYTSFVDLQWIARISQRPEVVRDRFQIRYAREVSLDELKNSNVILFGSSDANPWTELFQTNSNFQFERESRGTNDIIIRNLHPGSGEKSLYATDGTDPAHTTFGLLVSRLSLDGEGRVLLVEGINMAGTEAAAEYLFSEGMAALLPQLLDKKGNLYPFEILLQTSNIGANAAQSKRVALRIDNHPRALLH